MIGSPASTSTGADRLSGPWYLESPIPRVIHYFGHLQPLEHPGSLAPPTNLPAAPPTDPAQPHCVVSPKGPDGREPDARLAHPKLPRRRCIANSRQWKRTSLLRPGPSTRNRPYLLRSLLRRVMHRFIPAQFHDPVGLTKRLLKSHDPAALFAMKLAAAGPSARPSISCSSLSSARPTSRRRLAGCPLFWSADRRGQDHAAAAGTHPEPPGCLLRQPHGAVPRSPITANRLFSQVHIPKSDGFSELLRARLTICRALTTGCSCGTAGWVPTAAAPQSELSARAA